MRVWHSVNGLNNGQNVDAETFNRPIRELASRTDYLLDLFNNYIGMDPMSSTKMDVELSSDNTPEVGDVVCCDPFTGKFVKALASMSLYDAYMASVKAFALGFLVSRDNLSGTIVMSGKVKFGNIAAQGEINVLTDEIVEDGETFETGVYYLSSITPGRITRYPSGPRVIVGFFAQKTIANPPYELSFAVINPQYMDIESHAHRTFKLLARPAGVSRFDGISVFVEGYLPDGYEEATDSTDSTESEGIPRLSVVGDWTSAIPDEYVVTVSDGNGGAPSSWPVRVTWSNVSGTETGEGAFRMFGDEIAVGQNGLRVRIGKSGDMSEETPAPAATAPLTWTVGRSSGRGWAQAGANEILELNGYAARVSGVSDRVVSDIVYAVPSKIFCLTDLPRPSSGDTLTIDGDIYIFTTDPEKTDDEYIQILGDENDVYETYLQICTRRDSAFYDDTLRQVLVGADTVTASFHSGSVMVFDNENETPMAFVGYGDGQSLVLEPFIDAGRKFSVVNTNSQYRENKLSNGMTLLLAYSGDVSPAKPGDLAKATIYGVPGAKYRYAIEFDNDLKLHFPPVPARSGSFLLNGVEVSDYNLFGDNAVMTIGEDSLYWRDDAPGKQPWPYVEMTQTQEVDPEDDYREVFHFVSEFHSETGPVTSLRPAEGSPIKVRRCGTDEDASVGDLALDIDLMIGISDQNLPGYKVPKASRNGKLLLGPVVEKLIAGPGISFSKKAGMPDGQGTFTISADGAAYAGDFETVALENAKLESIGMFPYIRMLKWETGSSANVPTAFVAKFHVPATIRNTIYRVKFYASVFGESSFSGNMVRYAGVKMDYNILPDYYKLSNTTSKIESSNLKNGLIKPDESINLSVPFGVLNAENSQYEYDAYDPILIHNDPTIASIPGNNAQVLDHTIPNEKECAAYVAQHSITGSFGIRPGYTVAIRFSRTSPNIGASGGEEYTGAIGFLNLRWSIEEVSTVEPGEITNIDEVVVMVVNKLREVAAKSYDAKTVYDIDNKVRDIIGALRS